MSAELHGLRHKIRAQKKILRLQICAVRKVVSQGRKRIFRHYAGRVRMDQSEINFIRHMEARLEQHRAAMAELNNLTRK